MDKKQQKFLIEFFLFALFSCIIPFVFIAWRYELFSKVSRVSLSGWGIIAIIIIFVFAIYVAKSIKRAYRNRKRWSMTVQVIDGVAKVLLPLLALFFTMNAIIASADLFKQALIVVIICEGIAIPINPLPKWEVDNFKAGEEERMESFLEKFKIWWKGKDE